MSETINWLRATRKINAVASSQMNEYEKEIIGLPNKRRIKAECMDGWTVSIQAGDGYYCKPRVNLDACHYYSVELGYPSEKEELMMNYAEDEEEPTRTVYGYVPIELVDKILAKHGGIVNWQEAFQWKRKAV